MTTGWVRSLQCKSRALDDVVDRHAVSSNKHYPYHHLIPNSASCRKSVEDVMESNRSRKPRKPTLSRQPFSRKPESADYNSTVPLSASTRRSRAVESLSPALTELPGGHPSRNVVEIIFHTSWSERSFPGRVEMIFKVQSLSRTLARFEEYRGVVKSRAGSGAGDDQDRVRCVADGNEMMRFHCLGPISGSGASYDACGGGAWAFQGGKGPTISTFAGSGRAHESAGGGKGRRAMLVCRVIAGRVCNQLGYDSSSIQKHVVGYDSASGENGELQVFDPRAVLPCFLIIYKL